MANLDHAPSPSASCSQFWPWRRWRQNPHLLCVRGILSSVLSVLFAHPPCPPCQWKGKRVQSFSQENVPNSYNKVFCKSRSKFSSKIVTTPQLRNHDQTSTWKSWTKLRFQFFTNLQLRQSAKDSHTWAVSSTPFAQLYPCLLNFSRHSHLWENDFYAVGPWKLINWRAPSGLKLHCNKCSVCIVNTNSKASKSINSYQILVLY